MKKGTKVAVAVSCSVLGVILLLIIAMVFLFLFCRYTRLSQNPFDVDKADSLWTSEDGRVRIEVRYTYNPGQLLLDDETVEFEVSGDMNSYDLYLYYPNETMNEYFELWTWTYCDEDKFIATVVESTYFTEGEQIVFYRTDMGLYSQNSESK